MKRVVRRFVGETDRIQTARVSDRARAACGAFASPNMGVANLWKLLMPIGRRINIETLEHKTLAIDMSIWLTQFVKAMRGDDGRPVRAAHVLGTLRRIVRLLYHGIRPVCVFDGTPPLLKRRTIAARRARQALSLIHI